MSTATHSQTIGLPPLSGGRPRARALAARLPASLEGSQVTIDARSIDTATDSFADELVLQILVTRQARLMRVINVSHEFASWFRDSAEDHGVSGKLKIDV